MAGVRSILAARWGRRRRRWARPLRLLLQLALFAVGLVLFAPATDDSLDADVANLHFAAGPPIWLIAATLPLWRAPERGLPDVVRLRRRQRRVLWRISAGLLFAASLGLLAVACLDLRADRALDAAGGYDAWSRLHARSLAAGTTALWLLVCSPLPGLLDPLLWRLWPSPVRAAVRGVRAAEEAAKRVLPLGPARPAWFDPDRGAVGRPQPLERSEPARGDVGRPCSVSLASPPGGGPELNWDGSTLSFVLPGASERPVPVPLVPGPHRAPQPAPPVGIRRPVAELVWYTERHESASGAARTSGAWARRTTRLVLLDADGYRVGTVERVTRQWDRVAEVARAAGIRFAAYDLGYAARDAPRLGALLFPRRGRQFRLDAGSGA